MSRSSWNRWLMVFLVGALGSWILRAEVSSLQALATPASSSGWEYQTTSVDLSALTPKLTELSHQGWEVINIISIDTRIEQTPDGQTHILTQRVEVTSRKPR